MTSNMLTPQEYTERFIEPDYSKYLRMIAYEIGRGKLHFSIGDIDSKAWVYITRKLRQKIEQSGWFCYIYKSNRGETWAHLFMTEKDRQAKYPSSIGNDR